MKKYYILFVILFGGWMLGISAQSLAFNQVHVFSSADGLQTVPAGKCWKIENANGGGGTMFVTGALTSHCGTTCTGGSCAQSSCLFEGFIWELNGANIDAVTGCFVCASGSCYSSISNCPPTYSFAVSQLPVMRVPFWMKSGNTLRINATNVFFSVIEFNIVP